jgi:peptidoglycan hydrolase-like protein with peptidoglycan-binding domain
MTPRRLQLGLLSFALLSGAMAGNLFLLQGPAGLRGQRVELGPSPETRVTAMVLSTVTGSTATTPAPDNASVSPDTTKAIQRELETRGYGVGTPDGVVSLITRAAIMAYQADHAMTLTGEPGEDLLRAIVLGPAGQDAAPRPPGRPGPHAEQVIRTVQQSLIGLGANTIRVDGFMGEETVRAIRRFEREQGLPETGRISGLMVARLARLAALGQVHGGR